MKKFIACLLASAMVFGLAACGQTTTDTEVAQDDTVEYKELVDPRGKVLESTATGETNPQLVETLYETKDAVVADIVATEMGYAIDPTGETDSTEGIQQALYDIYDAGGGTLFLPAGNYAISDTIYIPPYTTLRGDWNDPDAEDFNGEYGTIISVWMESEDKEGAGAFSLGGSAGAVGLTIYYPLQTLDCVLPYPYTFFVNGAGASYMLSTVQNCTFINSYRGVGTEYENTHEQLQLLDLRGTFLYKGFGMYNSSDVGTMKDVSISTKYWKEASADCMNAAPASKLDAYAKEYTVGMEISIIEWTQYNDVRIDGCAIGVHTLAGARVASAVCMYDMKVTNCEQGFLLDDLDNRWGAVLARSYVEGGIANKSSGKYKVADVDSPDGITEEIEKQNFIDDEADLSAYEIDYEKSYVKPAANFVVEKLPNGIFTDAGPALQEAVDKMAEQGGGVVYVPGGTYKFHSPVVVPAGVEVRGTSTVASRDHSAVSNGTIFTCYYGDDKENGPEDQALITLGGENAGLNGVRIIYPENGFYSDDFNSTYAVRGTAAGVYVVNTMIVGPSYGVDFSGCDNHYIDGVTSTCYVNAFKVGGKGGTLTRCLQNGTVMHRMTAVAGLTEWVDFSKNEQLTELNNYMRQTCTYVKVEDAEDQTIYALFAYGVATGYSLKNAKNTLVVNVGNDNMGTTAPQFVIDGGSLTAINVMRYNGYSYDLIEGDVAFYTRIAIDEAAEQTMIKSK